MEFIIFILVICIVILFVNLSSLKKETKFIRSILERYSTENSSLKKEVNLIKESLQGNTFTTSAEEIKPEEIESRDIPLKEKLEHLDENLKSIPVEEHKPYFTPIAEEDIPKQTTSIEEIPQIDDSFLSIKSEVQNEEPIISYESQSAPTAEKQVVFEEKVVVESAFSKFIKNAEKQFADNWTGILGTAIMVLGIGYLSIYTALKVAPLFRILILWLYAAVLFGSYYFLNKKEKWVKTGLWLRSAGASLFLFGCFGASQIPPLTFITNPVAGYALIGIGIALNLFVGYIIKKQTFLSLHVILSILILCVIPEKTLATFLLAATTATIGIILSYKEKWEYHLLIVITAFIIFDIWFTMQGTTLSAIQNIFAILGIITVAGSCMFMQYRKVYENSYFDKPAFITHFTNWILFATGLILHSTGSKFKTFVLFFGAIICLIIARRARKKNIFWLYHLDGMVSFVLFVLSIIMLNDLKIGLDVIACTLYLFTLVCLFVVYKEKEVLLHRIFLGINHLLGFGLVIFGALLVTDSIDVSKITSTITTSIFLTIVAISIPISTAIKKEFSGVDSFIGEKSLSLNGMLGIIFSMFIIINSNSILMHNSFVYVLIGIALVWTFLKKKFDNPTFEIGRIIFYVLTLFLGIFIIKIQEKSYLDWTFALGIAMVIVFNWSIKYFYKNEFIIRFIGIIGANTLLLLLVYKYLPHYQIIQIFSLLGIALLNHEFLWINYKKNSLTTDNQSLLYILYYFFAIAGSLLFLYHVKGFTNPEIGLTCIGISIIEIYVLFAKKIRNNSHETSKEWTNFNFLNSELLLFNIILFGYSCLQLNYLSVYFISFAIVLLIGFKKYDELKRYEIYSFLFLISSVILTLFIAISTFYKTDKITIYTIEIATIILSILYSYFQFKSKEQKGKRFITVVPYIQNFWLIALLFIQVELNYLPLLFIILGCINFWLIDKNKIKISINLVPIIGLLAVIVSLFYSLDKSNSFTIIDWILQLSSVVCALYLVILLSKKEEIASLKYYYQIILNVWLSLIMFSQLPHKWLPVYWASVAILTIYLYHKKVTQEKNTSIVYYLLANLHLAFLSFNFYQSKFLFVYLLIFGLLAIYIYLASKWMENSKYKNSLLIYPATLSIGFFLYLTFDKGILTFFWILEALGLLILGIILKEKYFRYVSLSLVGVCVIRLMFFDLSNSDFLIRALVLLGVGVVLLIMNSLFKKYKDRFE